MTVSIRLANESDAPAVQAVYAPYVEHTAISFEMTPPDASEIASRMRATLRTHPWIVAEEQGRIAGYAYGSQFRNRAAYGWSSEVSVYLAEASQRRGLGRRLYVALLELLTEQGYRRAYGGITLPNEASVRLHQSLGFEPVGVFREAGYKFDAWHDVGWWQRALATGAARPARIARVEDVCRAATWSDF